MRAGLPRAEPNEKWETLYGNETARVKRSTSIYDGKNRSPVITSINLVLLHMRSEHLMNIHSISASASPHPSHAVTTHIFRIRCGDNNEQRSLNKRRKHYIIEESHTFYTIARNKTKMVPQNVLPLYLFIILLFWYRHLGPTHTHSITRRKHKKSF